MQREGRSVRESERVELISNCAAIPEAQISFTSGGRALIIQPFGNLVVANIVVSLTGRISLRVSIPSPYLLSP